MLVYIYGVAVLYFGSRTHVAILNMIIPTLYEFISSMLVCFVAHITRKSPTTKGMSYSEHSKQSPIRQLL